MIEGIGVHSGKPVRMTIMPHEHEEIVFSVNGKNPVTACYTQVVSTNMCTQLVNGVKTVEHFMSACAALNISSLHVDLTEPELPILDGSARGFLPYLMPFRCRFPLRKWIIDREYTVKDEFSEITLMPYPESVFDVQLESLGLSEEFCFHWDHDSYEQEIAPARTFGRLEDAEKLQSQGMALGASVENTVVFSKKAVMNPGGLRFPEEPARHKILDAIGDLYLSGHRIVGYYRATNPSHKLNLELVRMVMGR